MKWFRLYSSVLHDPKVQRLTPALFKHWVNLLCLASEQDQRGDQRGLLPSLDDIAFALRIKPSEAATVMTQLRRAGLVDSASDGRDFPHNWPQRQRESDDVAARVRRHREQKAAEYADSTASGNGDVTLHATLLKRPVDTETETEAETESDPTGVSTGEDSSGVRMASATPPRARSAAASTPYNVVPLQPLQSPQPPPSSAPRPPSSERRIDVLWDACVVACGGTAPSNSVERGKWNRGLKALRESGATAEEIGLRAERYRRRYGEGIALNPMALASNWTQLSTEVTSYANTTQQHPGQHYGGARAGGEWRGGSARPANSRQGGTYNPQLPDGEQFVEWAKKQIAAGATNIILPAS